MVELVYLELDDADCLTFYGHLYDEVTTSVYESTPLPQRSYCGYQPRETLVFGTVELYTTFIAGFSSFPGFEALFTSDYGMVSIGS